jgi:PPM family protein phosphatase
MTMSVSWRGLTHIGCVRKSNEDGWLVDPALCIAIVADGMGGAACGELGSAVSIASAHGYLRQPEESLDAEQAVREAIRSANRQVLEEAARHPECRGMGSTLVVAVWAGARLVVGNVGDSRAYLHRDGAFTQLSYDQTLGNDLLRSGCMSEDQIQQLPHRKMLTMAIGGSAEVLVHVATETLCDGDCILMCTDGLYGPVTDEAIARIVSTVAPVDRRVDDLVQAAIQSGGPDNITVVLLEFTAAGVA